MSYSSSPEESMDSVEGVFLPCKKRIKLVIPTDKIYRIHNIQNI